MNSIIKSGDLRVIYYLGKQEYILLFGLIKNRLDAAKQIVFRESSLYPIVALILNTSSCTNLFKCLLVCANNRQEIGYLNRVWLLHEL